MSLNKILKTIKSSLLGVAVGKLWANDIRVGILAIAMYLSIKEVSDE